MVSTLPTSSPVAGLNDSSFPIDGDDIGAAEGAHHIRPARELVLDLAP
jgi:hypothetical protein